MPDGAVGYSISGTPADCAHLGYTTLATSPIDLVVSGINNDTNLGYDVNYSGTVGAAMEAAAAGYPALAVSVEKSESYDWPLAAEILCQAVELYADWAIPSGVLVNLNIPNIISDSTWVWTSANPYHGLDGYRQVSASADEVLEFLRIHNDNQRPPVEGSDVSLSLQGRITLAPIVPMGFDQKTLERLKNFQQVVGGRAVGQKSL
jgi:5'-nucleotidase